jgi:hypothetical protein
LATRSSKRIVEACASASDFSLVPGLVALGHPLEQADRRGLRERQRLLGQLLSFGLDQARGHDVLDVFEAPECFFRDFEELFVFHRGDANTKHRFGQGPETAGERSLGGR